MQTDYFSHQYMRKFPNIEEGKNWLLGNVNIKVKDLATGEEWHVKEGKVFSWLERSDKIAVIGSSGKIEVKDRQNWGQKS